MLQTKNHGQVSIEFLLVLALSMVILSIMIVPSITNTRNHVRDINILAEAKTCAEDIAKIVNEVYSESMGASRTITIHMSTTWKLETDSNTDGAKESGRWPPPMQNGELVVVWTKWPPGETPDNLPLTQGDFGAVATRIARIPESTPTDELQPGEWTIKVVWSHENGTLSDSETITVIEEEKKIIIHLEG
ncbi:MAG: hypothetical protein DRO11_00640 [Methanobacteriota archaeon]|nr:MAG: hypothetical protein DRO11_00640 [Euryarchaeota archaeon]